MRAVWLSCVVCGFGILAGGLGESSASAAETTRPNILFVLCDDLRWDAMGCAGKHPHLKTPHIDRLAREGAFFENAFCTTSLCSPSRASILSGLYAHSHGVTNNFTEYPKDLASFPQLLHDAGYATAYLGKWHMGEENDEKRPGFDYFVTHKGQGKYFDTEFNLDGAKREVIPGYYTTVVTDLAVKWLDRQAASKGEACSKEQRQPWMMMLGHKAPHSFYFPEEKYQHAFDSVEVKYPDSAFSLDDKPKWIKDRLPTWHGIYGPLFEWRKKFPDSRPEAVKDFAAMTRAYWGTILSVDDSVGRLTAWLEQSQQLDNTIIVFMGDNGLLNDARTKHSHPTHRPLPRPDEDRRAEEGCSASPHRGHGPEPPRPVRRERPRKTARPVVEEARSDWQRSRVEDFVPLPLQLREAVPLHPERARRPHRRVEVHPLPTR